MTVKTFCNKCNKELLSDKQIYEITTRKPNSKSIHGYDDSIDFCSTCYKMFKDWLLI